MAIKQPILEVYQGDTISFSGALLDNEQVPETVLDKIIVVKIIRVGSSVEVITFNDADITKNENIITFEISTEQTATMFGDYLMQIAIFKDNRSVREIEKLLTVKKSY